MPTITSVKKTGATEPDGNAPYTVTVEPDGGKPGKGTVFDPKGHSAPWRSFTGDPVDVAILGQKPFDAAQDAIVVAAAGEAGDDTDG